MFYQAISTETIRTYLIDLPKRTNDIIVEVSFPAGYFYAPEGKQEVPHLLEHYLSGCLTATGLDHAASTNIKTFSVYAIITRKNFLIDLQKLLKIILNNPLNDSDIFKKEQKILQNELAGIISNPPELAHRFALNNLLVGKKLFMTCLEDFQTISLEDAADYYQSECQNSRATVCIGVYQADQSLINDILEATAVLPRFQDVKKGTKIPIKFTEFSVHQYGSLTNRAYLNLTWPAPISKSDPREQIAMMLISDLLSAQNKGFLWQALQEENGLVYEIDGHVDYYEEFGFFSLGAPFMPEDLETGFLIMLKQVERIKRADYPKALLKKLQIKCNQADRKRWNNNFDRFVWMIGDILDRDRTYGLEEWLGLFEGIDQNYLANTANKYLDNQRLHVSFLSEANKKINLAFFENAINKT